MSDQPIRSLWDPVQAADVVTAPHFDGETYDPDLDHDRLAVQLGRVRRAMSDGQPHTLRDLACATGDPEASVSARIRDLRKPKFGGRTIVRARVAKGLYTYRMEP